MVGALLALASGKAERRQVHPLKGSHRIRCYFCAVFLSVADVKSHRHRTESDRAAYGIRSGGERNLIGRRTESDRTANATGKSFKLSKTANIGRKSARNRRFDRKWLFFVRNILLFLQIFSLLCSRNLTQYCSCATHILYVCAERWSVSLLNQKRVFTLNENGYDNKRR